MLALRQLAGSIWKNNFFDDLFILGVGVKEKTDLVIERLSILKKLDYNLRVCG